MPPKLLSLLGVALFAPFVGLAVLPSDADCFTRARVVQGTAFITCDFDVACTNANAGALCDFDYTQIGSNYYHFCRCDGAAAPSCNGFLKNNDPDPEEGGDPGDVGCFFPAVCGTLEYCDENQLTGTWAQLCECKPE